MDLTRDGSLDLTVFLVGGKQIVRLWNVKNVHWMFLNKGDNSNWYFCWMTQG